MSQKETETRIEDEKLDWKKIYGDMVKCAQDKDLNYVIPPWCCMCCVDHIYGGPGGGCWGISHGCVLEKGEEYCKECEYYEKNINDPNFSHRITTTYEAK